MPSSSAGVPAELEPGAGDALIVVDVQNDFLPGGALGVPSGDGIVDPVNRYVALFHDRDLPVVATSDWHPPDHCSFAAQGGPWPVHCVAGSEGAALSSALRLPGQTIEIRKASTVDKDAYSGFDGTDLAEQLRALGVRRVFVAGLATDYCVLHTVLDALRERLAVVVLEDAIRAVDVEPEDGERAIARMRSEGAALATLDRVGA